METIEEWKPVVGYEGKYEISSLGRVKSLKRTAKNNHGVRTVPECMMKIQKAVSGYCQVVLCQNGHNHKSQFIHRLVAQAFIPNPKKYKEVNHKDEDKTNNCVSNLEWISHLSNCNYGTRNEKVSQKMKERLLKTA